MIDIIPSPWTHFRTWDYHSTNVNPILFLSLSPTDECFVWHELNIDPKKNTTKIIAEQIADTSGDYKFRLDRIDPLANENQSNTNTTVIQDLNKEFKEFKKSGFGTGASWGPYDTKYYVTKKGFLRGRDNIKQRLINSSLVKKPFNNKVRDEHGFEKRIPTLWISSNCRVTLNSIYKWRVENGKPSQKWSHHCTALEGIMKEKRFKYQEVFYEDDMDIRRRKYKDRRISTYFKI